MSTRIAEAVLAISTNASEFSTGVDAIDKRTAGLEKSFRQVGAALAASFSFDAIAGAAKKVADTTGRLADMAVKAGISAEAVQELSFAAQQNGTDFDTVSSGMARMSNAIVEAPKEAVASMKALGLSVDDLKAMAPDQAFEAIAAGIAKIPDPMQRSKLAMDLFGKSGADLLPVLTSDIGALRDQARDAGLVMSNDLVAAGDGVGDSWDQMQTKLDALKGKALLPALEVFQKMPASMQLVAGGAVSMMPSLTGIGTAIIAAGGPTAALGLLSGAFTTILPFLGPIGLIAVGAAAVYAVWKNWDKIVDFVKGVWTGLKTWVVDKVIPLIEDGGPLLAPVRGLIAIWKHWDEIPAIAQAVYTGVKSWLVDKFQAVIDSIKKKVDAVTGFFKGMYDKVVGNSFVPDLIAGIGTEFAKLGATMVEPARTAAGEVEGIFNALDTKVSGIVGTLLDGISGKFTTWLSDILPSWAQPLIAALQSLLDQAMSWVGGKIGDWIGGLIGWGGNGFMPTNVPGGGTWGDFFGRGGQLPPGFPGIPPIAMADGGFGRVAQPTLFLAGERGAEDFAFSGGGHRFAGDSETVIHTHVHLDGREVAKSVERVFNRDLLGRAKFQPA
jgi:hypothetical protein